MTDADTIEQAAQGYPITLQRLMEIAEREAQNEPD